MPARSYELHGVRVLECAPDQTRLRSDRDAVDLIGAAFEHRAALIVLPVECLGDDFFKLRTRIAGELIQKFVNYRIRLAIVGDISRHLDDSSALRAFVNESNRGKDVWFLPGLEELDARLAQPHPRSA